jgi:hypothetical protein
MLFINPHPGKAHSCMALKAPSKQVADELQAQLCQIEQHTDGPEHQSSSGQRPGNGQALAKGSAGPSGHSHNHFDAKTDKGSSDMYFHYYGMIMHQQNMLQVRGWSSRVRARSVAWR